MRILWLSNTILSKLDIGNTGTWLGAMAQRLTMSEEVVLGNVSMGDVHEPTPHNCPPISQWLIPTSPLGKDKLPPPKIVDGLLRTIECFNPDLVHIWGTESWWGLLNARGYLGQSVLLEMQGVKGAISRVYAGGLTAKEQRKCRGPKEIILGRSIEKERRKFASWGRFEKEIIAGCHHVAIQTPWVEAWVRATNPECNTYQSDMILRQEFYDSTSWSSSTVNPVLFCSAAYPAPFKGIHDVLRATALLSQQFPNIRLRIAGAHQKPGIRQDGYVRWLNNLCYELGVADRVDWLGALSAKQITKEYQNASVFIMSSHIENCCTAIQEALYLGTPTVSAYSGGVPSLARDEDVALYYPPGDEAMCAYQVKRLLSDQNLAIELSRNAREVAIERNNPGKIVTSQLEIYHQVITDGFN